MFGDNLKALRDEHRLTQEELARKVGVDRSYISQLEKDKIARPSYKVLDQIAQALHVPIGYLTGGPRPPAESPEEILDRLRLATPVRVPIYGQFALQLGAEGVEPLDYVYVPRPDFANREIEGYRCEGTCLEPDIDDGDTIIIDRNASIETGDIVVTLAADRVHVGRLRTIGNGQFIENRDTRIPLEECHVVAKVVLSLKWKQH